MAYPTPSQSDIGGNAVFEIECPDSDYFREFIVWALFYFTNEYAWDDSAGGISADEASGIVAGMINSVQKQ